MPNPFEYLPDVTDGRGDSRRPSDAGIARGGNAPGSTLVLAGAGTGKTSTLAASVSVARIGIGRMQIGLFTG